MKKLIISLGITALLCTGRLFAQNNEDPFAHYLIPPDLVMAHSSEIGLNEKQRDTIVAEIQKAQAKFISMQWQMKQESDAMAALLKQMPADEAKILAQADKVMGLEREIKHTHLSLLIRIKNSLTPEQFSRLDAMRGK